MATNFTTPVGRLVQGSAFTPKTTDGDGKPLVVKTGANIGEPRSEYYMAVAFAKNDPAWPAFEMILKNEAATAFPHLFPQGAAGPCTIGKDFSMKIVDGDGYDKKGKLNSTKDGFAGHWVVRFSSGSAPRVHFPGKYAATEAVTDPTALKTGYYVRIAGTVRDNKPSQTQGLYLNLNLVEIAGFGPEIISGPDANEAFAQPAALPPGASTLPVAGAPLVTPGPVTPPAAPVARTMLPAAGGATYEAMIGAGWTDALLIQNGMMAAPVVAPPVPPSGVTAPPVHTPAVSTPPAPVTPPVTPSPSNPPAPPYSGFMKTMLPAANGVTYEQYIAAGWTDAQLIASGMMAA